ncbi:hypothetical protein DSLASN_01540 [Desulfoluna limicola]|uniref:Uncharacterized protein n=1 Tax=Desulfoluna limicola TaxID=2810562 RepID=A0ABN6EZM4_9BACT|nr:hypothetical protein DSLASN_01540 [Desulfoluna limicola]
MWKKNVNILICSVVTYFSWNIVPSLSESQIQAIASPVSTVAGILFGFVMASVTLIISAKDNTLVRNTQLTGYLPKLLYKLHCTMGWLLFVSIIFLVCIFIPVTLKIQTLNDIKVVSILIEIGIFSFTMSLCSFFAVWREFSHFSRSL